MQPKPLTTAYTISLGTPEAMAEATAKAAHRPLLKIKLGGDGDDARIAAVRKAAPDSELIVDANESWTDDNIARNLDACAAAGVTLVEQPLPAGRDEALAKLRRPIAVCADESVHDRASLRAASRPLRRDQHQARQDRRADRGAGACGQRPRARLRHHGRLHGRRPRCRWRRRSLVAQQARVVDLDGALLLAKDRDDGLRYDGSLVHPPSAALWG